MFIEATRMKLKIKSNKSFSLGSSDPSTISTRQARTCMMILKDLIGDKISAREDDLKIKIEERSVELKTRQDPWRIFRYYQTQLVKNNFLIIN
jgi:hypothetical protein